MNDNFKQIKIGFEKDYKFFYTTQKKCDFCNSKLSKYAVYREMFSKSNKIEDKFQIICPDCRIKYKSEEKLFEVVFKKFLVVVNQFPKGSIFYNPKLPGFKNSKNLTVFDVADKQLGNEEVEDNTVYSNRLQSDYNPNLLEERDQKLLEKDLNLNSSLKDDDELDSVLKSLAAPAKTDLLEGSD